MNKQIIEKLYYKNDIDTFFNCDFEDSLKVNNSKIVELNFGKDHMKKSGNLDNTYKNITSIIFEDNRISFYYRGMWKYTNEFITAFEIVFGENDITHSTDKMIVYFEDIEDIFKKLKLFLSIIKNYDNLILNRMNKTTTNKEIMEVEINAKKYNYSIDKIGITDKNTIVLIISYDNNNSTEFLKEINKFRVLDDAIAQNRNRIEFSDNKTIGDIIEILNKNGWSTDYLEYNNICDNEEIDSNLDSISELDYYSELIFTCINNYNKSMDIKILKEILSTIIWKWTERNGKLLGCKIWSEKALKLYNCTNKIIKINSVLTHEHIIPRKIIIDQMINNNSIDNIKKILINSKAAVILKEEDKKLNSILREDMPKYLTNKQISNYTNDDIFSRYKTVDIPLFDVEWNKKEIKNKHKIV